MMNRSLSPIGRIELVQLPEYGIADMIARVDTGAQTSALWASGIVEQDDTLSFCLFGPTSPKYSGQVVQTTDYGSRLIRSSSGQRERRFTIKTIAILGGHKISTTFTLADRSLQRYPALIGRNILRGKFIVDVQMEPSERLAQQDAAVDVHQISDSSKGKETA
jgi:hypothetical protein